ncbi:MAG: PEP-CTERM sorting domain-containing protein [Terrimicrobiaceae bacterium]
MKILKIICYTASVAIFGSAGAASAAVIAVSSSAPTTGPDDIANLTGGTNNSENNDATAVWSDRPGQGQSFATGSNVGGYTMTGFTLQNFFVTTNWAAGPWNVQVGTLSGSTFTPIITESTSGTVNPSNTSYLTWTLDTPLTLSPNTLYAFYVSTPSGFGMVTNNSSTGSNPYANGTAFSSTADGQVIPGGGAAVVIRDRDRIFQVDLAAVPEPSTWAMVLGGMGLTVALRRARFSRKLRVQ